MPQALIYKPAKNAMQSGIAGTKHWVLEYMPDANMAPEPLMGWNSMKDTTREIFLYFASQEEAVEYAKSRRIPYRILPVKTRKMQPKSYADNFSYKRVRTGNQTKPAH